MSRPARIDDADAPIPRLDSGMRFGSYESGGATSFRAAANSDVVGGHEEAGRFRVHLPTPSWRSGATGGPLSSTLRFGPATSDDRQSSITQGSSRDLMGAPRRLSDQTSPGLAAINTARRRSASRTSIPQTRHSVVAAQARDVSNLDLPTPDEVDPTPFPPPSYLRHSTFWDRFYTFAPSSYASASAPAAPHGNVAPPRDVKASSRRDEGPSVLPLTNANDFDDPGGPIGLPTHWDRDDKWHLLDVDATGKRLRFLGRSRASLSISAPAHVRSTCRVRSERGP